MSAVSKKNPLVPYSNTLADMLMDALAPDGVGEDWGYGYDEMTLIALVMLHRLAKTEARRILASRDAAKIVEAAATRLQNNLAVIAALKARKVVPIHGRKKGTRGRA